LYLNKPLLSNSLNINCAIVFAYKLQYWGVFCLEWYIYGGDAEGLEKAAVWRCYNYLKNINKTSMFCLYFHGHSCLLSSCLRWHPSSRFGVKVIISLLWIWTDVRI
jgi:hypothetical protein